MGASLSSITSLVRPLIAAIAFPFYCYRYRPLPCCERSSKNREKKHECTHIRLLTIHHANEKRIECSLRTFLLADAASGKGQYHCLSYTWSNPLPPSRKATTPSTFQCVLEWIKQLCQPPEHVVICDGRPVPVTFNLWNALVHLCKNRRHELEAIWIDQICINQRDTVNQVEKSSQVSSMHRVFEMAESVVMWLGHEKRSAEDLDLVEQIATELRRLEDAHPEIRNDPTNSYRFDGFEDSLRDRFGFAAWSSLHHFLCRPYFSRMWVFQEVVTAKKISVLCGDRQMSWLDIRNVSQAFTAFGFGTLARYAREGHFKPQYYLPHSLEMWRALFRQNGPDRGLRSHFGPLVIEANRALYSCSVGHDKLYAHFGVCRYTDVEIDYNKTVEEVYSEFWGKAIMKVKDVNLLTAVENDNRNARRQWKWWPSLLRGERRRLLPRPPMPSWVPDFQENRLPDSLSQHYSTVDSDSRLVHIFSASASSELSLGEAEFQVCPNNRLLTIRGHRITTITELSESNNEIADANGWCVVKFMQLVKTLADETQPHAYIDMESRIDAFLATMMTWSMQNCDAEIRVKSNPTLLRSYVWQWLRYTLCVPIVHQISSSDIRQQLRLLKYFEEDEQERFKGFIPTLEDVARAAVVYNVTLTTRLDGLNRGDDSAQRLLFNLKGPDDESTVEQVNAGLFALYQLRMFRTRRGFIGKGPQALKSGDEIWIFPGAAVPFILRRTWWGRHILVGHAYVHGIMNGELVGELKDLDGEVVTLV